MEIGIETIRLGSFRKNALDEQLIKKNATQLKRTIKEALSDIDVYNVSKK